MKVELYLHNAHETGESINETDILQTEADVDNSDNLLFRGRKQ